MLGRASKTADKRLRGMYCHGASLQENEQNHYPLNNNASRINKFPCKLLNRTRFF